MTLRPRARRRSTAVAGGLWGAYAALHLLGRRYGSTRAERTATLPGDELVVDPLVVTDHAVTIAAPPSEVWPWLVQMGWHRGGWYTARWVDRALFPQNLASAERIHERWQHLAVGDRIPDGAPETECWFVVKEMEPDRHLVLHSTSHLPPEFRDRFGAWIDWSWVFVLRPVGAGHTRLHFRTRARLGPRWLAAAYWLALVPADFVMSRQMLEGLRRRVERRDVGPWWSGACRRMLRGRERSRGRGKVGVMGSPRRKLTIRTVVGAAVLAVATACPPPAPPAPELPDGVGFAWVRDEYGAPNEFGNYVESYARYQVLDGVRTGPTPPDPTLLPFSPTVGAAYANLSIPVFPDGTAKFGWNGFAGEGITTTVTQASGFRNYEVTGPGGSCTFSNYIAGDYPTSRTTAAIPSPDGTKLAVYTRLNDPDASTIDTWLSIRNLDASCTQVTLVTYEWSSAFGDFSGERITNPFVVWSPSSSALLFSLEGAVPGNGARVMHLDATPAASATVVLDLGTSTATPTGWSVDDRVILTYNRMPSGSWPAGASVVATTPVGGGALTNVDFWDLQILGPQRESHYGYYVPDTSLVVYSDASRTAVNAQGTTMAWPRFRLYDDATGGWAPLPETALPLTWRPTMGGQDLPVVETLDRFVR